MKWVEMKRVALPMMLAATAWAQPVVAPRDAGVPAAPKAAVAAKAADGGVTVAPESDAVAKAKAKADAEALSSKVELERMKAELAALKERTAALEKQAAQNDAVSTQLEKVNKQLGEMKTQMAEAEDRRQETQRRSAERKVQADTATSGLVGAMQALEGGTASIGPALDAAEAVYTGPARRDIELCRGALANKDLFLARYYLSAAIADAEAGRY